jgi:hypothetical protein
MDWRCALRTKKEMPAREMSQCAIAVISLELELEI